MAFTRLKRLIKGTASAERFSASLEAGRFAVFHASDGDSQWVQDCWHGTQLGTIRAVDNRLTAIETAVAAVGDRYSEGYSDGYESGSAR